MSKVFVMGLDGATLDVMMPMIERGELPAFEKIMINGGYGRLRSVVPPLSPPAWTSFATGKNPGKNGIIGFTKIIPHSYRLKLVNGQDNSSRTIWELSSLAGKKVIVMNVPMTYPPAPVNGVLISGLDTPGVHSDFMYPPALKHEIFSIFPSYKINLQLGGYLQTNRRRRLALRMIFDSIESRYRVAEYLMDKYPWDIFIVKFNNPDIVQHHFWKYMDPDHPEYDPNNRDDLKQAIFSVYRKLDEIALSFMSNLDNDTTFMVMSDHGAGTRINKVVYVNEWLRKNGYLHALDDTNSVNRSKMKTLYRTVHGYLNKPLSFLFRHISPQVRIYLKNLFPKTFSGLSILFKFSGWLSAIDWSKTAAFLAEEMCIRINLIGVYPQGMVDEKDYVWMRDEVIQKLKALQDPETGETIFADVLKREDAFGDPPNHALPDIQLVTKEAKYDVTGKFLQEGDLAPDSFIRREKLASGASGMHRPDGIFFITGPYCRSGREFKNLQLIDLCPTILGLLGVPIPKDVDGRFIKEAFQEDFLEIHPITYKTYEEYWQTDEKPHRVYSGEEESRLVDNLKSLGYID
jgi:predicted AlkP superfamily phosphohydrolase/phosphomutase